MPIMPESEFIPHPTVKVTSLESHTELDPQPAAYWMTTTLELATEWAVRHQVAEIFAADSGSHVQYYVPIPAE